MQLLARSPKVANQTVQWVLCKLMLWLNSPNFQFRRLASCWFVFAMTRVQFLCRLEVAAFGNIPSSLLTCLMC
jgi:hypothetical protein